MDSLPNCREFYSLSLPLAKRLFHKNRHRMDLLDDHIHAGVNYFATTQEIVREWQVMWEDTLEFKATKKYIASEWKAFNVENKGLLWRVIDNEEKLVKEKQFNANCQKECEDACERTNRELKDVCDDIVRLKGEKTKENDGHECMAVVEKTTQNKTLEILAEEISTNCKWLIARGVPLDGYGEGGATVVANEKDYHFELHKVDCTAKYTAKRQEYGFLKFGIARSLEKLTRKGIDVETLKKALEDEDAEDGDAGLSHQVLRMNGGHDRLLLYLQCLFYHYATCLFACLKCTKRSLLLCLIDPAVHLVMNNLGGLQCLCYLVYDAFVYTWVRSNGLLTCFIVCIRPGYALSRHESWRCTMFSVVNPTMFLCIPKVIYAVVTKIRKRLDNQHFL
ncbi:hypothetical protein Hanom_Chr06g00532241 [Helianthus anomalus]